MAKEVYILSNQTDDEEIVIASESKEKMINFAVDYIIDNIEDEIEDEINEKIDENLEDEEYLKRYKYLKQEREKGIREWATDLVNGKSKHRYSDELSNEFFVWIYIVKLI